MLVLGLADPRARKQGYGLLQLAARECWGLERLPELVREARGKPYFQDAPNCHFNISHSGAWVVCAADHLPVGVDIQKVRPCREELLRRVCSPAEQKWYRERGSAPEDFSLLWAIKESLCKYTGEGLRLPISEIQVPLPVGDEELLEQDGLRFYLKRDRDWQICLCTQGVWDGCIRWLDSAEIPYIKE